MAEFKMHHHRSDSDSSDESIVTHRSIDPPPTMNRDGNRSVGKRSCPDATLINPGPPALYRLNTERTYIDETDETVRRWTYGRRDRNKQNKAILLIGESGTGKTTMINTMVNYLLGVKFKDNEWYEITEEKEHKHPSLSKTSEITVYEVFVEENPTSLTIIDTPGYADTEGFKREREISDYLINLFSHIDYIDAVCFVMKASQNRISGKERFIFHLVLSLFGDDIEKNIVFIITHSDGGAPTDALNAINTAQIHCRCDKKKKPVHFLFNNQQKEKREHGYKSSWEIGKKSMKQFLELLAENNRKSLQMKPDLLTEPKQLEAIVFNQMDCITEKELKMKELTEILEAMSQNRNKIEKSEKFTFSVNKTVKTKPQIENENSKCRNATCCPNCEENCHLKGCWWVSFGDLSKCDVMKYDYCTVCTGKCHYKDHKKEGRKYVITTKNVEMSFEELKQEYGCTSDHEKDMKESEKKTKIEEKLISDLEEIKTQKFILLNEAYMTIMKLSRFPLKRDRYITPEDVDFFIRRLEEKEKEMDCRWLEEREKERDFFNRRLLEEREKERDFFNRRLLEEREKERDFFNRTLLEESEKERDLFFRTLLEEREKERNLFFRRLLEEREKERVFFNRRLLEERKKEWDLFFRTLLEESEKERDLFFRTLLEERKKEWDLFFRRLLEKREERDFLIRRLLEEGEHERHEFIYRLLEEGEKERHEFIYRLLEEGEKERHEFIYILLKEKKERDFFIHRLLNEEEKERVKHLQDVRRFVKEERNRLENQSWLGWTKDLFY